ncbi:hypothetical protein H0H92_003023 [Tricholoma furcatifolium]|nr:hypothetical protein H0H92_003023 [Tricholoma furcatifolium]
MSGLGSWLWGTSTLDDAVGEHTPFSLPRFHPSQHVVPDKATSELLPAGSEDIALNLEICDQIRSKSAPAKDAMRALKRRLNHKNPNVQNLALGLTDICVKNGGDLFLAEVASREFMDNLVSILKVPGLNRDVKQNILRLIQNWSIAFEGKPALSYVGTVYKTLLNEGFSFPPKDLSAANSAMVDTQTAPEWIDSECSSKTMALPHFGITQEVRVCDGCYNKMTRKAEKTNKGHRQSVSMHNPRHKTARDLADADLQRAIELSLQEVGAVSGHSRPGYVPYQPTNWQTSEPPIVDRATHPAKASHSVAEEEDDPDLRAAIEASLREANAPKPSAPVAMDFPRMEYSGPAYSQSYPPGVSQAPAVPAIPSYDLEPMESDAILTFSQTIEQVQAQGGRDISRYPAVNELYDRASGLRPKLALSLDDAGRKEQMLSDMHEKLSQAVKLYDQLLTEQIQHPRWRSSTAAPQQPVEPATYGNQWTSPVPASTSTYQVQPESSGVRAYQPQYTSEQPYVTPVSWQIPPSAQEQYTPVTAPSAPTFSPPPQSPVEPQRQQSYIEQPVQQQYQLYTTSPPIQTLPPVTLNHQQYQPRISSPLSFQPSQPQPLTEPQHAQFAAPPSAPPPPQAQPQYQQPQQQPQQPFALPSSSPITRHKTVSYVPSAPMAPAPPLVNGHGHGHVVRSNTIAAPPAAPVQQLPSQQQQQRVQVPVLPQFPIAPTTAPQMFNMPSVPTSLPDERKEALLIDL